MRIESYEEAPFQAPFDLFRATLCNPYQLNDLQESGLLRPLVRRLPRAADLLSLDLSCVYLDRENYLLMLKAFGSLLILATPRKVIGPRIPCAEAASYLPRMRELYVTAKGEALHDEEVEPLFKNCPSLTVLGGHALKNMSSQSLKNVFEHCVAPRIVNFHRIREEDLSDLPTFSKFPAPHPVWNRLAETASNIEELRLSNYDDFEPQISLAKVAPNLKSLYVHLPGLGSEPSEIFKACSNLTMLDLTYCDQFTLGKLLESLEGTFSSVKWLELREMDKIGAKAFENALLCFPALESLGLRRTNLTDQMAAKLNITSCPRLSRLDLAENIQLSESLILSIAADYGEQLTWLDLSSNRLSNKGLKRLITTTPSLQFLALNDCSGPSKTGGRRLGPGLHRLRAVQLNGTDLGKKSVMALIALRKEVLEELQLSGCSIGDDQVAAIASHCPNLRILNLTHNPDITSASLMRLTEGCSCLEDFSLSTLLSRSELEAISLRLPWLKRVVLSDTADGKGDIADYFPPYVQVTVNFERNRCPRPCTPGQFDYSSGSDPLPNIQTWLSDSDEESSEESDTYSSTSSDDDSSPDSGH